MKGDRRIEIRGKALVNRLIDWARNGRVRGKIEHTEV